MFLGPNSDVYVQEFSTNHMNGLRHCSAVVDKDGCVDPCFQGRMWKHADGETLFGGPETGIPDDLKDWLSLPSDDVKCKSIEDTIIVSPPASTCPTTTPAPVTLGNPTGETKFPSDMPTDLTEAPVPDPTGAPILPPTDAPVSDPTEAPIPAPVSPAPVPAPVSPAPVPAPISPAPVPSPVSPAPFPNPTEAPISTEAPTEKPGVSPTDTPVPDPTEAPVTEPPTLAPVVPPTDAPNVPPKVTPVVPPTDAPVTPTTSAPVVPTTCILSAGTTDYAIISEGDADLNIQSMSGAEGFLVGGDLSGGQGFNFQQSMTFFVGGTVSGSWNQQQYIKATGTLNDYIDYAHLQYVASKAKSSTGSDYTVVVYTSGGTYADDNVFSGVDYNTRCNNPSKYLLVFNTMDDVTISISGDNTNLCYSVLAPAAKLTIEFTAQNPGETRGFLVGAEVTAGGKSYKLNNPFDGEIACDPADPTTAPNQTVSPSPTAFCELPFDQQAVNEDDFAKYSLITKEDANIRAHNIYSAIAIGGTLTHAGSAVPRASLKINSNSGLATTSYALLESGETNFDFGLGTLEIGGDSLADAGVDFALCETLALKVVDSTDADDNKVFVIDQGDSGGSYNLYDFRYEGQGSDGENTLVFFTGAGPVSLTLSTTGDRHFGASVIAPFAKVILMSDVGYIDGFLVAKQFDTTGEVAAPQMHGTGFLGELLCE